MRLFCAFGLLVCLATGVQAGKPRDYYQVLEIEKTANTTEVIQAYRRLARKFHPDTTQEENAKAKFREVQDAMDCLSDKAKRAAYDRVSGFPGPANETAYRTNYRSHSEPTQFAEQLIKAVESQKTKLVNYQGQANRDPQKMSEVEFNSLMEMLRSLKGNSAGSTWERVIKVLRTYHPSKNDRVQGASNAQERAVTNFLFLVADEFFFSEPPVEEVLEFVDHVYARNALPVAKFKLLIDSYLSHLEFRDEYHQVLSNCFVRLASGLNRDEQKKLLVKYLHSAVSLRLRTTEEKAAPILENALTVMGNDPSSIGEYLSYLPFLLSIDQDSSKTPVSTWADQGEFQLNLLMDLLADIHEISSLRALAVLLQPEHTIEKTTKGVALRDRLDLIVFDIVGTKPELDAFAREQPLLLEALQRAEITHNCRGLLERPETLIAEAGAAGGSNVSDIFRDDDFWTFFKDLFKNVHRPK